MRVKPKITLEIIPIKRGKDGKRRRGKPIKVAANSWLKVATGLLYANFGYTAAQEIAMDGASHQIDYGHPRMDLTALATDTTHGILAGTGTTPVAYDDYNVETLIAHGNGANQLYYNATVISATEAITGGYRVTVSRQLDNNSGGAITVQEVGLAFWRTWGWLMLHDLISGGYEVADGDSVILRYKLDWTA